MTSSDRKIIDKILEGYSLRTLMIPDPSIRSNSPEHLETYDLPHVIISGAYFLGKSETTHFLHRQGDMRSGTVAYCYTNFGQIFCVYNPQEEMLTLMDKKRYKKHIWKLKKNFRLIWDSKTNTPTDVFEKQIESCSKLRVALLDEENVWNIHDVDLPLYYINSKEFVLKTVIDCYPLEFRYPEKMAQMDKMFNKESNLDRERIWHFSVEKKFYTFYSISSDGTYYSFYDIPRSSRRPYERLMVYSDAV